MLKHRAEFRYDVIHFNNGLHGWHLTAEAYKHHYEKIIQHLMKHTKAVVILALSTPITKEGLPMQIDSVLNEKVQERNRAVEYLAGQANLLINDLYMPMIGHSEYRVDDGYHYNLEGEKEQAEWVVNAIKRHLY
jgi:lysophospholipase L1-like esterase